MTVQTIPLASLVEDWSIYPRHSVDTSYVGLLIEALRAGVTEWRGGPVVVEDRTKRIVDGWHRVRATRRVRGDAGDIEVDLRSYPSEAAVLEAAISANTEHGRKLDHMDRVRCAMMLAEVGVARERVALILRVRETELPKMTARVAPVPAGSPGAIPGTARLVLKRPAAHMAGKTLTKEQVTVHASMPGTSLVLAAHQLRDALRVGFVRREDESLITALRELRSEIDLFGI